MKQCAAIVPESIYRDEGRCLKPAKHGDFCSHHRFARSRVTPQTKRKLFGSGLGAMV